MSSPCVNQNQDTLVHLYLRNRTAESWTPYSFIYPCLMYADVYGELQVAHPTTNPEAESRFPVSGRVAKL